jgi:carbamoyl-phosphate synthase small subunit
MKAVIMLEDGKVFQGEAFGANGERIGRVIFNTAVVGYQEMLTDPANAGKILVLTYPLIGNYGCAPKFNESKNVWASAMVIREKSRIYSNWQAKSSLEDFVKERNLLIISGVDTRTLAIHLRQKGEMPGIISTQCFEPKSLLAKLKAYEKNKRASLLDSISVKKPTQIGKHSARQTKIALLDIGLTQGLLAQLQKLDLALTLFPYNSTAAEILRHKPRGLIITNGPEEDLNLEDVVKTAKSLIGKLPILGISTGHQVLAGALGAKISRMKLGHHGVNYPVSAPASYKGEITVQNHSCVVDAESLSKIKDVRINGYNLHDQSVEEFESKKLKLMGLQYCPCSPGFGEVHSALKKFVKMIG